MLKHIVLMVTEITMISQNTDNGVVDDGHANDSSSVDKERDSSSDVIWLRKSTMVAVINKCNFL